MNQKVDEIFKSIQEELGKGSFQYYSTITKSHYLYVNNRVIFLIHSDEIGPEALDVGMYIIKPDKQTSVPIEVFVGKIPFSELEDFIYRFIVSEDL